VTASNVPRPAALILVFRKRPPSGKDLLTDRVRQLGARDQLATPQVERGWSANTRAEREAVFKDASLILPDGHRIRVVIKDLNAEGARVEYFQQTRLPEFVEIAASMLKLKRRARVVWQNGAAAGLQFLDGT
jgi:hypothetical protein